MNVVLALRLLWRDWRSGELTLLLTSLIVAVSTVTTITLFVDRLNQALLKESSTFLASDRVVSSANEIDVSFEQKAESLGLETAQTLRFVSMVFSADRAQFASVKAVTDAYPLRGRLIVSDQPFVDGRVAEQGPPPGEVWLESRLAPSLGVSVGDLVDIGVASFRVGRILIKEPDRGGGFTDSGPRVMMHMSDVPATEVVQPASRIRYRLLLAGDTDLLTEFDEWARPQLGESLRLFGVKEGAEGIGRALERAERFLLLGGLLGVVLAGVAIALSAQRYSLRHYDHVAILKTLGAAPNAVDGIFAVIFVVLGLVATVTGTAVGLVVQYGVAAILDPFIPIELPNPGIRPMWFGLVTGFVCLLAYALPPLLRLRSTEPVRVIRRDLAVPTVTDRLTYGAGVIGTLALMWWYSADLHLTLLIFGGGLAAVLVLWGVATLMLRSGRVLGMQAGSAWRLALAGMQRRGQANTLQILVFGLAIMLLLILFLVRTALIDEWSAQIPEDAPNHFAINISPEDVAPIRALFAANGIASQPLFPMIRGRIRTINGESALERGADRRDSDSFDGNDDGPRASSGRNLTWSSELPDDNRIVSGEWWPAGYTGEPLVSVEEAMARRNSLIVGDELVFSIQGRELSARIASIRTVSWDNMQPNFYIIFSPHALDDFPSTFITSFKLEPDQKLFLNDLLRDYPTMTVLEIDALIEQVKIIIAQVTMAIELVLLLILVSGALVLLASVQASMDDRFKQHAILRTLGASRRLVMGSLIVEFCVLGFFAGVLATLGAEVTVFGLETEIFELNYEVNPSLWLLGPVLGTILIGVIGTLATLRVVQTPPNTVLRAL